MKPSRRLRLPPWLLVYAGLIATIVLLERNPQAAATDPSLVSPVAAGESQPFLATEAIARRSDL